ncbi:MAG: ankyrin repeat domain-containing protein [Elusimicrobiota bacterium]|nr:MAG: ankyrin repeat domain-containing protein [Elusimicrobiota bacterium]
MDSEEVMELLLKNGAKPDVKGKTGNTPLAEAVAQGSMKKAELLLRFKADVNAYEGAALYAAMGTKNFPMLKFLKKQGADLNIKPRFWLAPLIWAVSAPHYIDSRPSDAERAKSDEYYLPVVKWLLENGADKNVKDDRDRSALQVATSPGIPRLHNFFGSTDYVIKG